MNEYLFRGKRVDNGELVISDSLMQVKGQYPRLWVESDVKGWVEVIPETLGQYTGLKDKNGNRIFGGDIVRITTGMKGYKSTYHSVIQKVRYEAYECGIAVFYPFDNSDTVEVEVIGNIYDKLCVLQETQK